MSLSQDQAKWLTRATGLPVPIPPDADHPDDPPTQPDPMELLLARCRLENAELARADEDRRQFLLKRAKRTLDPLVPVLTEASKLELVTAKKKKIFGKEFTYRKTRSKFAGDDPSQNADSRDIRGSSGIRLAKGAEAAAPMAENPDGLEDKTADIAPLAKRLRDVHTIIFQLRDDLLAATTSRKIVDGAGTDLVDGAPTPLFTQTAIVEELFKPLLRSGVAIDNFLPGGYSPTQAMLDKTTELYKKDLTDENAVVRWGISDDLKGATDACASNGDGRRRLRRRQHRHGAGADHRQRRIAEDRLRHQQHRRQREARPLRRQGRARHHQAIPGHDRSGRDRRDGNAALGKIISSGGSALTSLLDSCADYCQDEAKLKDKLARNNPFATFLSNIVSLAVSATDDAMTGGTPQADTKAIGDSLGTLLKLCGTDSAGKILLAICRGQAGDAVSMMGALAIDIGANIPAVVQDVYKAEGGTVTDLQENPVHDQNIEASGTVAVGIQEGLAVGDAQKAEAAATKQALDQVQAWLKRGRRQAAKSQDAKALEALKEKFAKESGELLKAQEEARVAQEVEEFKTVMDGLDGKELDLRKIEDLTRKLKRYRAIWEVMVALGLGGASVVAQFLPVTGAAISALKMVHEMKGAYDCVMQLWDFRKEKASAANTNSPYLPAIENMMGNLGFQLTSYSISAATNGLGVAVKVVSTVVPHAAPAGPAFTAVEGAVATFFAGYKQKRLRDAWKATKEALADPANRRLGQRARRLNPTFAKYTIAYGATEERDPIAIGIARKCGLTPETLKSPNTNADKVKKYLEAKFPDDGTVKGYYPEAEEWTDTLPEPAISVAVVFETWRQIRENRGLDLAVAAARHAAGGAAPGPEALEPGGRGISRGARPQAGFARNGRGRIPQGGEGPRRAVDRPSGDSERLRRRRQHGCLRMLRRHREAQRGGVARQISGSDGHAPPSPAMQERADFVPSPASREREGPAAKRWEGEGAPSQILDEKPRGTEADPPDQALRRRRAAARPAAAKPKIAIVAGSGTAAGSKS